MATDAHNPPAHTWATLTNKISDLNLALSQSSAQEQDRVEREIVSLQDQMMEMSAPSIAAVADKLRILWSARLDAPDQDGRERRLILSDLEALIAEADQLLSARA